jgi:hypothetical protein
MITNKFDLNEDSLRLYEKYCQEDHERIRKKSIKKNESLSQFSSCTILSYSKLDKITLKNHIESTKNKNIIIKKKLASENKAKSTIDMNKNPIKQLSDETLSVYLKYINCSLTGPKYPTSTNIKLYESYCKNY